MKHICRILPLLLCLTLLLTGAPSAFAEPGAVVRAGTEEKVFAQSAEIKAGMQVVIYNESHGMAIRNETYNNWYMIPETISHSDEDTFVNPSAEIVWNVVTNGDGSYSFINGENKIGVWKTADTGYIELTNSTDPTDTSYFGIRYKWFLSPCNEETGSYYLLNREVPGTYGYPSYIECYTNEKTGATTISGYSLGYSRLTETEFGFRFFVFGEECTHSWDAGTVVRPTCTEEGFRLYTCTRCGSTKREETVPASGHKDTDGNNVCDTCGADLSAYIGTFLETGSISDGDLVVIYNPGYGMGVKNEVEGNNWYLLPEPLTPENGVIANPDIAAVWTAEDNGDGTWSFSAGENKISAWYSVYSATGAEYLEITNDTTVADADWKWNLKPLNRDNLFYISSAGITNSSGTAGYLECYHHSSKDTTYISGYFTGTPSVKNYGFRFYKLGTLCDHNWVETETVPPSCTEEGYTVYECLECGAEKTDDVVPATGHSDTDGDGYCDCCGELMLESETYVLSDTLTDGAKVVIYNPGSGVAVKNETYNNWYLLSERVTPVDRIITDPDAALIWVTSDCGDGTWTFRSGSNAIVAWVNGNYLELTNKADYTGGCGKWTLTSAKKDSQFFIGNAELKSAYSTKAYLEIYTKDGVDRVTCYGSANPGVTNFGFQFYTRSAPQHEHEWEPVETVEPTCEDDGYTIYECASCGETKQDDPVPATGHGDRDGNGCCDFCGTWLGEGPDPAVCTHVWGEWEVTLEPTCTSEGEQTRKCTLCVKTETQVIPAVCPSAPYPDAPAFGNWAHAGIDFCIARGLMGSTRTGELLFEPFIPTSRAMIVSILYRLSGSPDVQFSGKFPDVAENAWYAKAVVWAADRGVVVGYDSGKFGPNDSITREQLAVILKGYTEKVLGKPAAESGDLSAFPDSAKATWSKTAVQWAVAAGLISGKASGTEVLLDPQGTATRAECASILMRYIQTFAGT